MSAAGASATLALIRRWLMAVLMAATAGTLVELLLIAHYEDVRQLVPLGLLGAAFVLFAWQAIAGGRRTIRAIQALMVLLIVSGAAGIVLHYRGNLEFQLEIDASQTRWALFTKVIRAKSPPALAPALMTQLGLLGLAYTFRHPSTSHLTET